ncbi:peptide chain release factor N(5)-glutamine methyltransferase [Vibrio cincinnatiensis]|uniref:peptide chain release factor N(5)-glutamine methyltransferase n=1 Tax=Vibrio cincinnatiensis TaxID=675 RepID=UPI0012ACD383|nr:peptide chain release factor N(5)-glutamine methyltransferase [Vibrio cincinnatiensis]MCG3721619.1 peptide chain release factor N(5)-glutamine methyltransferase [Vibrio cincinnatiensis]MCG3736506.1 peptide chain release factor N(5)-glutamine methyltransferase [Vibrio cincinnatiensis]MCG3746241.1 peptide chain release factor N(5)-glutamine methyltransferase [Vibrio cincinnatiensis]MCG3765858.1 peptide chain release factor N(5)-glutamine methyltransferase [Vibrio cincinnatiensis]
MSMNIEALVALAKTRLAESGSDSPSLDAAVLLCHVLQKPRSYLLTWPEKVLTAEQQTEFDALLTRRLSGEPVAYIIGEREFWSLPLKVSPSTLIPRPDTERLVELALEKAEQIPGDILDLGTGTGAIALALASELPARHVFGVDLRHEAQQLAIENSQRLQITNVTFLQGSWFTPLVEGIKFALIVSNPPYIEESDPHLEQGDVRFEPKSALVAEDNGLADIKYIAQTAREYLLAEGWLLFEHGYEQATAVQTILKELGYQAITTEQDYAGNDRVTLARL